MTILQSILKHSRQSPSKIAIYEGEKAITYAELWENIICAAAFFASKGQKGDRVVLSGSKNVDFVYAYFGVHLAGLIAVTVEPEINATRMQRIINAAGPIGVYGNLSLKEYPASPYPDFNKIDPLKEILFPNLDDNADILFTTGTTGMPKGIVLTHRNEWQAAININTFIRNTSDEIELLALPLSHSFGLGRLRCTMQKGATIDLLGSFASMKKFYQEMDKRHITGFGMVPASWNYLCKMSGEKIGEYADQLKYIEIGSAFMPVAEKERLLRLLPNTRICMHYGLTEASRSAFMCFGEERDQLNTIGYPSPNTDIKIFDDQGIECDFDTEGEICVKGNHVCSNFWGDNESEYEKSFYGDYFRTGDCGYKAVDGRFYIKSRKKELINVGGKKVSPVEVEEVLNEISGIIESACIAEPDPVFGEVVKAYIVTERDFIFDPNTLQKQIAEKLEAYKRPALYEQIDQLPKTSSGKLQRLLLKK